MQWRQKKKKRKEDWRLKTKEDYSKLTSAKFTCKSKTSSSRDSCQVQVQVVPDKFTFSANWQVQRKVPRQILDKFHFKMIDKFKATRFLTRLLSARRSRQSSLQMLSRFYCFSYQDHCLFYFSKFYLNHPFGL